MKISEIQPGMSKVDVTGEIIEIGKIRDVRTKYGKQTTVANAVLKDESGTIKLTLWGEQIEKISVGNTVEIKNGYASEWQGEKQLSLGKYGEMKIL
jgi:replication factor A1